MTKEPKTLLIIDDDPENRAIVINYLSNNPENYTIYTAPDGYTGIEIAREEKPDLIILDWQMPGMDGIEVLRVMKKNECTKDIPVIMYTGIMTDSNSLREALELGAYDFLRKPIQPIELEARIKAAITLIEKNQEQVQNEKKIIRLEKQKLEIELKNKNKEATDYAMFLASKNESLVNIVEKLKLFLLTGSLAQSQYTYISNLISEIHSNVEAQQNFERFTELFNQLHPSFSKKIESYSGELSQNEVKLLTFIKLNFTNKQISSLLNVSSSAVEKSKYRLKQRLNLRPEESLTQFVIAL
ncbi:MAG: response regulator [Bacteroidetes bacterium]|nr:response regulator [Bacteroidota bacterium]